MKHDDAYRQYKNVLKQYVLNKANVRVVSPGDCKLISTAIEKNTGKIISETTLKRFLGFARQEYNLSAFTLNSLSEFVGFKGWEDFCHAVPLSGREIEGSLMWDKYRDEALKVTCMTQTMLTNLSGVPFAYTVSRASKEHDFSYFLESKYQLFCLTGAPGMGKSVQMAHLVEKFFLAENAPYKESIVLLLKPGTLKTLGLHADLEEVAHNLSREMELNFLEYFYQRQDEVKGKVVLMIDGFDEFLQQSVLIDLFFNRIVDLLSYFKGMAWLKIVLALRPATWKLIKEKIDDSEHLRQTWFSGFYYQRELRSNLLPLNERDVRQVIKIMQHETRNILTWNSSLTSLLGYPYFIHLCYQSLKKRPHTVLRANTLFCELIASYVFYKIDRSQYAVEMNEIFRRFMTCTGCGISGEPVPKDQLLAAEEDLSFAYHELIAEGVLQEKECNKAFSHHNEVLFVHQPLSDYFIARELLSGETDRDEAIQRIMADYTRPQQRKTLLKWVLWHRLLNEQKSVPDLLSMALPPDEKGELFIFICDLLEDHPGMFTEEEKRRFTGDVITFMVRHFFTLSRLGVDYDEAFHTLLKHVADPVDEANLSIFLAVLALARFDREMLYLSLNRLQHLDKKIWKKHYPFSPFHALKFIEGYYTGRQPDYAFLDEIDAFIRSDQTMHTGRGGRNEVIIAQQLAAFVLMLCKPPMYMVEFVSSIKKGYPGVSSYETCAEITVYLEAFAYLQCSMKARALQILEELEACHPSPFAQREYSHAALMAAMIRAEMDASEERQEQAINSFLKIYHACKDNGFVLLQIYAILSLLKVYKERHEYDKAYLILDHARKSLCHSHFPIEELILKRIREEA